jgi:hypothetical protein
MLGLKTYSGHLLAHDIGWISSERCERIRPGWDKLACEEHPRPRAPNFRRRPEVTEPHSHRLEQLGGSCLDRSEPPALRRP